MPPYPSTSSMVYPAFFHWDTGFSLKVGLSLWLAVMRNPANGSSGSAKATTADPLRVT